MRGASVDISDLLGLPHEPGALWVREGALDCAGATAEAICRSIGPEARRSFLGLLRGSGAAWSDVTTGSPMLGDVVVSDAGVDETHVGAVVSLDPTMVLTSARRLGVFVCRIGAVSRVRQILRYPVEQP